MLEFSLKHLEAFVAVAELGSFTAGSQALYLSQSTVSAHVRTLERALGAPLFIRESKRRVYLTEAGRAALPRAQEILRRSQMLGEAVRAEVRGELRLAASTVPCQCLLPGLMAAFLSLRPDCAYVLKKGDSAQVHRLLEQREARLGFAGAKLDEERFDYRPLLRDKLVLLTAASPRFRELRSRGTLGRELLAEPMLLREPGSGTRRQFEDYLRRLGPETPPLRVSAQIEEPEALLRAVASGVGVTVCSELAARAQLDAGRVLSFELDRDGLYRDLYLLTLRGVSRSPLEQAFIDHVCSSFPA